jgi:hypothetical protein
LSDRPTTTDCYCCWNRCVLAGARSFCKGGGSLDATSWRRKSHTLDKLWFGAKLSSCTYPVFVLFLASTGAKCTEAFISTLCNAAWLAL